MDPRQFTCTHDPRQFTRDTRRLDYLANTCLQFKTFPRKHKKHHGDRAILTIEKLSVVHSKFCFEFSTQIADRAFSCTFQTPFTRSLSYGNEDLSLLQNLSSGDTNFGQRWWHQGRVVQRGPEIDFSNPTSCHPTATNICICLVKPKLLYFIWVIDQVWGQDGWILAKFDFCVFMVWDEVEIYKLAKKERGLAVSSHLDRTNLVNKGFIIWLLVKFCLWDTAGSPEQARWLHLAHAILPARVANHSVWFGSFSPLVELAI